MKTITAALIAVAAIAAVSGVVAQTKPDPSPEKPITVPAPKDPASKEEALRACFTDAKLTEAKDVEEYEKVRYVKTGVFYFGSKIWLSTGTDKDPAVVACLRKAGATR